MRSGYERIGRDVTLKQAKRSCLDKVRYASRNKARDKAAKMANTHPEWDKARPYKCGICSGYHLTTATSEGKHLTRAGRHKPQT